MTLEAIVQAWPAIVGAEMAQRSLPIAIVPGRDRRGGRLVIRTDALSDTHQLAFMERQITVACGVRTLRFQVRAVNPA